MLKTDVEGSFIVSFFWNANKDYALAIRNKSLQIEVRIHLKM